MSWITSHSALKEHPKRKRLSRLLGLDVYQTIGLLHCLWWWAMDYAPDGDLSRFAAADIAAVSFSTLRHTLVALDTQGDVLFASPNRDARAVDQTMRLIDTCADEIYRISGHRPMPNLMACKLQWLRDTQPDLYEKTTTVFTVEDYFNFKLTGVARAERTNAGETMLYDLASNRWSDELIEKLALKRTMFPVLVDSGVVLGHIT